MGTPRVAAVLRPLTQGRSRRELITTLVGGLLTVWPLTLTIDVTEAKRHGKHKRKRKRKGRQSEAPPPAPPALPPVPPPPSATVRIDATWPLQGNDFFLTGGRARLAQTFRALASGPLVSAQLDLIHSALTASDYVLRLSPVDDDDIPTNDVLAVATVAAGSVPDGASSVAFIFPTPFAVVAGTTYALVLARPGLETFAWSKRAGDACFGQGFDSENDTAPFEVLPGGPDLIYTTFVSS